MILRSTNQTANAKISTTILPTMMYIMLRLRCSSRI
ncbi:Uncharacterised protein [Vibrio cholerae]|nr:Uncharacterised protein [Vibrio cholerae]CSI83188.1 Uncharacterised protein [Vibrio cholerae]